MESSISESKENNPLTESQEIRKKAREELNVQLQGYLNNQPIENPTEENIEDEVNRLMEEVDLYEKNYVPKDLDENEINELNKFEEEFGEDDLDEDDISEDENEIKEKNNIKNNINIKDKKNDDNKYKKNITGKMKNKRSNIDMDLDLKNLENIVKKDYKTKDKKNKKEGNIMEDKEIQDLYNEYDKLLDKELEQEVEKEFKPKLDIKDIKRADLLLKVDPLINEALVQGRIKKDELVLFIDYYEIFSLSNKAKKFTTQQLQKIDELCYKKNNNEKNKENNDENNNNEKNKKKEKYDLNDENAIDKLTSEIEKGLQDSEEILMKKLDYEKYKMDLNKKQIKNKKDKKEEKNDINKTLNKNNNSSNSSKTIKTNYTLNQKINNDDNNRPISSVSEISNFTEEELNSVPRYSLPSTKKEKSIKDKKILSEKNILNISSDKSNKTFYQNNKNNLSNNSKDNINNINNQNQKPKTPLNQINKVQSKRNSATSDSYSFSSSIPSGKKTIPPLKKSKNSISLKSKSGQNIDLFDDNANPINMSKYRGARKELVKLKMGGKSKVHELFINKPRNLEENEKIKQKFMEFIKDGKDNKKNQDISGNKKSTARKKIEDAKNFNKSNK